MQQLFGECHRELPSVQKKKRRKKKVWRCKSSCLAFFLPSTLIPKILISADQQFQLLGKHLILKCLRPPLQLQKKICFGAFMEISHFGSEKNQMQTRYLKHLGLRNETHLVSKQRNRLSDRHHLPPNVSLADRCGIVSGAGGNGPLVREDGSSLSAGELRD